MEVPHEVRFAAEMLPLVEDTDSEWDYHHADGNYDPSATLSAVRITLKQGIDSSPAHILLYHKGRYVGSATPEPRAFVSLRLDRCTDDTVAVQFAIPANKRPGSITLRHNVEYRWDGAKVVRVGKAPPPKR